MKTFLLVLLLFAASSLVAETDPVITNAMALRAASLFRNANPFSEEARGYAAILVRFTEKSPDVVIGVSGQTIPFLHNKDLSQQEFAILLGALIAGNHPGGQAFRGWKAIFAISQGYHY